MSGAGAAQDEEHEVPSRAWGLLLGVSLPLLTREGVIILSTCDLANRPGPLAARRRCCLNVPLSPHAPPEIWWVLLLLLLFYSILFCFWSSKLPNVVS